MNGLLLVIQTISDFLWGTPMTIALIGTGLYLSIKFKFRYITKIKFHFQKIAPGPPIVMAVATPPIFPTPIVFAIAVQAAANPDTVPSPSPFPLNIFPNI